MSCPRSAGAWDPLEPGLLGRLPQPPRKVMLLRASRLGDFICAIPAYRALRAVLPDAEITMITLPVLRDLAVRLPYFDRYLAFPGFPGIAEQFFEARHVLDFFARVQAEEVDLAIQMQESGAYSNPFTLMLGASYTVGFVQDAGWTSCLDAALPIPRQGHEIDRILALAEFLGAPARGRQTEFPLTQHDVKAATEVLAAAPRPYIGLHPGAYDERRRWPPDKLGRAGAALQKRSGGTVVVLGGENDRAPAAEVMAALSDQGVTHHTLNLVAKTSVALLGAITARLHVLIANDSGPAHVAYALGTPAVIVYLPVHLQRYGPARDGPYELILGPEGPDAAVTDVPLDNVLAAAERLLWEQKEA